MASFCRLTAGDVMGTDLEEKEAGDGLLSIPATVREGKPCIQQGWPWRATVPTQLEVDRGVGGTSPISTCLWLFGAAPSAGSEFLVVFE